MKAAGIAYLKRAIEAFRTQVLGLPPNPAAQQAESTVPASQRPRSYTQALLDRFQLPQAQWSGNAGSTTGQDFYSFLSNAVNAATAAVVASDSSTTDTGRKAASASRGPGVGEFPTGDLSASGTLVPPSIQGNADKMTFLAAQRERLNYVLSALDREAAQLKSGAAATTPASEQEISLEGLQPGERPTTSSSGKSTGGLSKSRSEVDFEKIDAESGAEDNNTQDSAQATPAPSGGSWLPWAWSASSSDAGKNKSE